MSNPLGRVAGTYHHSKETTLKLSGKNCNFWKGGKPKCPICGKLLSRREYTHCQKHIPFTEERKNKMRGRIGERSPRWIEDRTKLKIDRKKAYDTKYKYWMLEVKKRDNFKCKIDNLDCAGKIEAHHILSWREYTELRYSLNNGITLCQAHHPKKRAEEKRLIPIFKELVPVSN